jgi:hypothetical protein
MKAVPCLAALAFGDFYFGGEEVDLFAKSG